MIERFAVVGNPIAHSLSPLIHQYFAAQIGKSISYQKIKTELDQFEAFVWNFFNGGGKGLNITSPFKEKAFEIAEVKHPDCYPGNTANTLWFEGGKLNADNTDGRGLIKDLSSFFCLMDKKVLLIGAGGAARSIIPTLFQAKIKELTVANRTFKKIKVLQCHFPQIHGVELDCIEGDFDLIINSTSLHLIEKGKQFSFESLLSKVTMKPTTCCYDLGYAHLGELPLFAEWATLKKCTVKEGTGMLIEQAAESFYQWHGIRPVTKELFEQLRFKKV